MKEKNLYLTLAAFFILISVFLSFRLDSNKRKLTNLLNYSEEIKFAYNNSYAPNKLLFMNLSTNAGSSLPLAHHIVDSKSLPVVFLKKGFCSSCLTDFLPDLIGRLNEYANYLIVSHPENANLIRGLLGDDLINEKIVWHDDYLYGRNNLEYDAELLFVDQENRVTGIIPLDYLKTGGLYEGLVKDFLLK
jgi:hypothetical protein